MRLKIQKFSTVEGTREAQIERIEDEFDKVISRQYRSKERATLAMMEEMQARVVDNIGSGTPVNPTDYRLLGVNLGEIISNARAVINRENAKQDKISTAQATRDAAIELINSAATKDEIMDIAVRTVNDLSVI